MSILCKIVADDEPEAREVSFEAVPRVGEYLDLGRGEPYRVTVVLHQAADSPTASSVRLDVTRQIL
jgi:hypothetical protein